MGHSSGGLRWGLPLLPESAQSLGRRDFRFGLSLDLGGLMGLGYPGFAIAAFFGGWVLSSFLEGFADLPVVAEGVEDAAYAPGVLGSDGADDGGAGGYGAVEGGFGVFDGENHANGAAVEGLGAEILIIAAFLCDPTTVALDSSV